MVLGMQTPRLALVRAEGLEGTHGKGLPSRSILIVTPSWPYPPTWGFAMRVYHLAKQLSTRHRVSLLTYGGGGFAQEPGSSIFESVHLVQPPAAGRTKRRAQTRSLFSPRSYHLGGLRSHEMETVLTNLLARHPFDLVQLESSQMGFCAPIAGVPTALDEHNVEYMLLKRLAGAESSFGRKAFGHLEAGKVRREELRAWTQCDGVIFTSTADMAAMRSALPERDACVVPNGVDLEYFRPASDEVGSFAWRAATSCSRERSATCGRTWRPRRSWSHRSGWGVVPG